MLSLPSNVSSFVRLLRRRSHPVLPLSGSSCLERAGPGTGTLAQRFLCFSRDSASGWDLSRIVSTAEEESSWFCSYASFSEWLFEPPTMTTHNWHRGACVVFQD